MFTALDTTMLEYYVENHGLPYVAENLEGKPIGFIFQDGEVETAGLRRAASIDECKALAR